MRLELEEVKELASSLDGDMLETLYRPKPFLFEITPKGFVYTPESGKPEPQGWKYMERFLKRLNKLTRSCLAITKTYRTAHRTS